MVPMDHEQQRNSESCCVLCCPNGTDMYLDWSSIWNITAYDTVQADDILSRCLTCYRIWQFPHQWILYCVFPYYSPSISITITGYPQRDYFIPTTYRCHDRRCIRWLQTEPTSTWFFVSCRTNEGISIVDSSSLATTYQWKIRRCFNPAERQFMSIPLLYDPAVRIETLRTFAFKNSHS